MSSARDSSGIPIGGAWAKSAVMLAVTLPLLIIGQVGCGKHRDLPPVDRTCQRDADCDTFNGEVRGRRCCVVCRAKIGSKRWVSSATRVCDALGDEGCPRKKCPAPPEVACVKSRCEARGPTSMHADGAP